MYTFTDIFYLTGLFWGLLACVLIFAAITSARRGNFTRHKHLMLVMLSGGWSFVLLYLAGYALGESYSEMVPPGVKPWLIIHGIIALATLLTVTILIWARLSSPGDIWRGNSSTIDTLKVRAYINRRHKVIGMITAFFWLITQIGGFINLYILK